MEETTGDLPAGAPRESDLPEAAERRMQATAFTSGLSVPDFAACLSSGLEPIGYVQGSCVMQWQFYGAASQMIMSSDARYYSQNWRCPHGMVSAEHRAWGQNYEQYWLEQAWSTGFNTACARMIEEATALGADGVVGVVDHMGTMSDLGVVEFTLRGTAVRLEGSTRPVGAAPWTTFLAGARLTKLIEAGYAPISVVAASSSVRIWASCVTGYLMEGNISTLSTPVSSATGEIEQVVAAHEVSRELARRAIRATLGGDSLHGASLSVTAREYSEGDGEVTVVIRGNRVRRFAEFEALEPPRPVVHLT